MKSEQAELELRCFCHRKPLLGVAGRGTDGKGYVHIKTWKGNRLYAEVVIVAGTAMVRCRECLRWHRFRIRTEVQAAPAELPESITV